MMQNPYDQQFASLAQKVNALTNALNAQARQQDNILSRVQELRGIEKVLGSLQVTRGGVAGFGSDPGTVMPTERRNGPMVIDPTGQGYLSLDQIPGRHIPFDFILTIPIVDGQPSTVQQTLYVTTEGPMIVTARYLAFQSAYTYTVASNGNSANFFGRSYGRFRSTSSHADVMDAVKAFTQPSEYQPSYLGAVWDGTQVLAVGNPAGVNVLSDPASLPRLPPNWPGNGLPIIASPYSMASSRTMGFDGLLAVEVQGAQYKRQSQPVPSQFWGKADGSPWPLSTLDVFMPGEVVQIQVTPTHPNNPNYGNVQSLGYFNTSVGWNNFDPLTGAAVNNAAPAGLFPFASGQFDGHEGINGASVPGDTATTPDPVTRNATGLIYAGFQGYKIIQPPAVVR